MTTHEYKMPELLVPIEATVPVPKPDPNKEAAMRAAVYYDRVEAEREEFRRLLEQSKVALQNRDHQLATLGDQLVTERNRYDALQSAYNEALQDRADLEAILATQQAHHEDQAARLSKFEFSRLRRKRNGKRNGVGESVSDASGSEAALAELASVVVSANNDQPR